MALLPPQLGLAVLEGMLAPAQRQLSVPPPLLAASAFAWDKFMRRFGPAAPALFSEFAAAPTGAAAAAAGSGGASLQKQQRGGGASSGLSAADRKAAVQAQVQEAVRSIMGADISADEPLMAAGLDSLGAVELKNSLEGRLGLQLPGTLVFDYPSASAIAAYVETLLPEAAAEEDEEDEEGEAGAEWAISPLAPRGLAGALPEGTVVALVGMSSRSAQVGVWPAGLAGLTGSVEQCLQATWLPQMAWSSLRFY